ncbi:histidine kinase [Kordia sp.]|uniref:sensor histidine kinase n=1 Tax=Kordia sp. TaxID=1965332 RepID=UPI0025C48DBE|nr:histidine kinase [Kordia sp.]MCH2196680.1 histidine kinase [Kordia sp.]
MQRLFVNLFFWNVFFVGMVSHAQEIITKNLGELASLPDNEFYDVLYDSNGNYWFCADSGLYRFDGMNFTHYTNPQQRSQSLFNLKEDKYGRIWCNSLNGQFFVIDSSKGKLDFFIDVADELIGQLPKYELYKNHLFVKIDNNKFFQYHFETKEKTILTDSVGEYTNIVRFQDALFYHNMNRLNKKNLKTNTMEIFPLSFKGTNPKIYNLDENLYILLHDDKFKLTSVCILKNGKLVKLSIPKVLHLEVYDVYKDSRGLLYFGTEKGGFVMEETEDALVSKYTFLQNSKVSKTLEDAFGNYIFTTLNNGIYYWDGQENFKYQTETSGLLSNNLNHIVQTDTQKYVVTDFSNNVYEYVLKEQLQLKNQWHSSQELKRLFTFDKKAYVIGEENNIIEIDGDLHPLEGLNFSSIKDITKHKGKLYVGHSYNLEQIESFHSQTKRNFIRKKRCLSVASFEDKLYGAFTDGTFTIQDKNYTPVTYQGEILYTDRLLAGTKYLWAFKKNQGLFYTKNNTFQQLTKLQGKNAIVKKSNKVIYILESGKLFQINEKSPSLDLIKDISSRLKNIKIVDFEVVEKTCFLTSEQGILQISLQRDKPKKIVAPTIVKQVLINEIPKKANELTALPYNENSVKIFLKNKDFSARNSYSFRYKINNVSSNWETISDIKNPIYLSYLSPANYEVIYQTLQNETVIHENSIHFHISHPYWKTWWFITAIFIGALSIVFVIVRLYLSKIKTKQHFELEQLDLEKNLAEAKLQNLTSQMNPHFTFNALNTVQGLILDDKKEDAYTYLAHFSNLFRKSIDFSSKTFNTFDEEIAFLETYLKIESKRFNEQLMYQIDDTALDDRFFKIPAMILQPFVENAIKHGLLHKKGDKQLQIQFLTHTEHIECIIIDNGIGRKASGLLSQNRKNAHLNIATSSVQKRFDLYKKHHNIEMIYQYHDLAATNGESLGTKVMITIPLMK